MTTGWPTWDTDYTKFTDGLKTNHDDVVDYGTDKDTYQNTNLQAFDSFLSSHTAEEGLLFFFYWIATCTTPEKHDNILGIYDDQTTIYGDQMSVNARNTTLSNDIQNLINDTVPTDPTKGGVPVNQQIAVAKTIIRNLINTFNTDPRIKEAYDPNTSSGIVAQLTAIQTELNTDFDPTGAGGKMTSFDDMKTRMGNGDQTAIAASKAFTDAAQILTSLTQNMSAALNQKVSQSTGMDKNWQSFIGSLMKSMLDEMNSIIQNLSKG